MATTKLDMEPWSAQRAGNGVHGYPAVVPAATPKVTTPVVLPTDSKERKEIPLYSGLFQYFPDALAAVAHVSYVGNQKHNPGQPLHWSRGKSDDHADCIARHLLEAGGIDQTTGVRHSAQLAWRALALLQLEIERAKS